MSESVCWLICKEIGTKNLSAEYLSGYLKSKEIIVN